MNYIVHMYVDFASYLAYSLYRAYTCDLASCFHYFIVEVMSLHSPCRLCTRVRSLTSTQKVLLLNWYQNTSPLFNHNGYSESHTFPTDIPLSN